MIPYPILKGSELQDEDPMVVVIILCGSTSLVALTFSFITFSLFSDARDLGGISLMNLLASLFLGELLHIIGLGEPSLLKDPAGCVTLTLAHQYITLSQYSWLLAMVRDVQGHLISAPSSSMTLMSSSTAKKSSDCFVRNHLIHWGLPAVIVAATVPMQMNGPSNDSVQCWISSGSWLGIYIVAALLTGLAILVSSWKTWTSLNAVDRLLLSAGQSDLVKLRLLFALKLLLLLSAVLSLGITATTTDSHLLWQVFHVVHSLQGVGIAVDLTCNCKVVKSFSSRLKLTPKRKSDSDYGTSNDMVSAASQLNLLTWRDTSEVV